MPIQTTLRGARAAARAMGLLQEDKLEVTTVQGCRPCGGGAESCRGVGKGLRKHVGRCCGAAATRPGRVLLGRCPAGERQPRGCLVSDTHVVASRLDA